MAHFLKPFVHIFVPILYLCYSRLCGINFTIEILIRSVQHEKMDDFLIYCRWGN